jgi:GNAT superfamily N-acetyltransferase
MDVRRIRESEWRQLRELRLRALEDAPYAFRGTLADEAAKPDEWWRQWAAEDAAEPTDATFVASEGGRLIGLAAGFLRDDPDVAIVAAMWVDPAHRRRGAARALIEAVESWAAGTGATRLRLSVTDTNPAALDFYLGCGFAENGETQPAPGRPDVLEIGLEREIRR